jgi:hypothetical protein
VNKPKETECFTELIMDGYAKQSYQGICPHCGYEFFWSKLDEEAFKYAVGFGTKINVDPNIRIILGFECPKCGARSCVHVPPTWVKKYGELIVKDSIFYDKDKELTEERKIEKKTIKERKTIELEENVIELNWFDELRRGKTVLNQRREQEKKRGRIILEKLGQAEEPGQQRKLSELEKDQTRHIKEMLKIEKEYDDFHKKMKVKYIKKKKKLRQWKGRLF